VRKGARLWRTRLGPGSDPSRVGSMLLKVDHYTSLARAVGRLDRDSYEARGAVYDRALAALIKRLNAAEPPYAQADIDMELLAFREEVRRGEVVGLEREDGPG